MFSYAGKFIYRIMENMKGIAEGGLVLAAKKEGRGKFI